MSDVSPAAILAEIAEKLEAYEADGDGIYRSQQRGAL